MEFEKENYRENFEKLKNLKTQIEHAQYLIEKSQVKLQKDFEIWWTEQCEINEQKQQRLLGNDQSRVESISSIPSTANSLSTSSRINSSTNTTMTNSYQNEKSAFDYGDSHRKLPQIESESKTSAASNQKINLTGDSEIDADITAFINARKRIINQMKPKN